MKRIKKLILHLIQKIIPQKTKTPIEKTTTPQQPLLFQDACIIIATEMVTSRPTTYLLPYNQNAPLLTAHQLRERGIRCKVLTHHEGRNGNTYKSYTQNQETNSAIQFNFPTQFISIN